MIGHLLDGVNISIYAYIKEACLTWMCSLFKDPEDRTSHRHAKLSVLYWLWGSMLGLNQILWGAKGIMKNKVSVA